MKFKLLCLIIASILLFLGLIFITTKSQQETQKTDLRNLDIKGRWRYVTDPFCDEPGIKILYPDCDTTSRLIEIEYGESYVQALLLFETTDALLKIITENQILINEKTIVKIQTPLACAPIYVDPHSYDEKNSLLMRISDNVCDRAKLESQNHILFIHRFFVPGKIDLGQALKDLPIVKEKSLAVIEEQRGFYRIFNQAPQKNIVLKSTKKSYWEYVYIFVKHDSQQQTITIKVDSFLGAGVNPPNISDLAAAGDLYEDQVNDFIRLLKQQILTKYNGE